MIVTEKPKEIIIKDNPIHAYVRSLPWYIMHTFRGSVPYLTLFLGDDVYKQQNLDYLSSPADQENVIYDWVLHMNHWGHYEWKGEENG